MHEYMYVNSREKSFMIFYDFFTIFYDFYKLLHYRNNMHESMYVNLKRFVAYLLFSRVTSRNDIIA